MNKLLLFASLCLVLVKLSTQQATGITVAYKTTNCECTGVEIKDGKHQREFRIICKKTEDVKKGNKTTPKTVWHTSCTYGGDPHPCKKYNKQQAKYYQGLINVIGNDYCITPLQINDCKTDEVYHSNTICDEIPYTFNKIG